MNERQLLGYSPDDPGDRSGPHNAEGPESPRGQRRAAPQIYSVEECLSRLSQLPGLIALHYLTPADAGAIRTSLSEILRHHRQSGQEGRHGALTNEDVLAIYRRDPEVFNLMSGLLTDAQVDLVMRQATDGDEQA